MQMANDPYPVFFQSLCSISSYWSAAHDWEENALSEPFQPIETFWSAFTRELDVYLSLQKMRDAVMDCISERNKLFHGYGGNSINAGRCLVYSPLPSMGDALACAETHGFYDEADAPPYVSWGDFVIFDSDSDLLPEAYLLAWIPKELESVAQQGMSVSMGRSLFWLDEAAEAANYGPMALRMSLELVPRLGELPFEM